MVPSTAITAITWETSLQLRRRIRMHHYTCAEENVVDSATLPVPCCFLIMLYAVQWPRVETELFVLAPADEAFLCAGWAHRGLGGVERLLQRRAYRGLGGREKLQALNGTRQGRPSLQVQACKLWAASTKSILHPPASSQSLPSPVLTTALLHRHLSAQPKRPTDLAVLSHTLIILFSRYTSSSLPLRFPTTRVPSLLVSKVDPNLRNLLNRPLTRAETLAWPDLLTSVSQPNGPDHPYPDINGNNIFVQITSFSEHSDVRI